MALVIAPAGAVRAQEQEASLAGVVRDTAGAIVPGVSMIARNQAGLAMERVTDAQGAYRFPSLPPGSYELTAHLDGFAPANVPDVDLRLGQQLTIDVVLRPAGVNETVVVSGSSPLIAVTQSARTTNLRGWDVDAMPRARDFTSLATQAAGANNERKLGGLSVDGSSAAENRFVIDGMETTDLGSGLSGQGLVTDFVEELQVKSSGYSAEYGGSTGAVLNVVTRSGSNVWHGDGLLYWSGDGLDAGPRPTLQLKPDQPELAEYVTYPEDSYGRAEPGVLAGGPLLPQRLWMFAGYVPSFQSVRRTVTAASDGVTRSHSQQTNVHNLMANAMATLGRAGRLRGAFSSADRRENGLLPPLDGSGNPAGNFAVDTISPSRSASVDFSLAPSQHVLLGARAGVFSTNQHNEGVYRGDRYTYQTSAVGFPGVPPQFQQPRLYSNVATNANGLPSNLGYDHALAQRVALVADSTAYFRGGGEHQLKGGIQLDRISDDELSGATGNGINLFWGLSLGGQRGPFGYYRISSNDVAPNLGFITQGRAAVTNVGLFIQDSWQPVSRLTVNLGVRTENEHVPSFSADPRIPSTAIHFGFGDKLAPRLGFAWDPTGSGKTKVYASWGVFYDITKLSLPITYFGGAKAIVDYYSLDSGDISAIVDNPACPPECPGRHLLGPIDVVPPANDPDHNLLDPKLTQMRLQEAAAGVERELAPNLSIGARYLHKQLDRGVEDIGIALDDQGATTYLIGNPGFGQAATFYPSGSATAIAFPRARREYDAIEATLNRRLSNHWSARVSYTWSRLWGNYSGLSQSDEDGRVSPNVGSNFDYPMMSFDGRGAPVYGVLATDRPHQVKASLLFAFPVGTTVGVQAFGASGVPRTRVAAFTPGQDFAVMYEGRNSDGRLPVLRQLDLYLQHTLRTGPRWRVTFSANVINLFNGSTATTYYANELFQGQAIEVDETQFYRGIDTQQLIADQGLVRDARFLMNSGFQDPRSVRLGVKLGF